MKRYFFNPKTVMFILAAVFFALFTPQNLLAWGDEGHRIVARIAAANLTPTTRQKVTALLQNDSCPKASSLADRLACASTWADAVRNVPYPESYNWHFVDISLNFTDYVHNRDCEPNSKKGDCGLPALENLELFLKNAGVSSKYSKYSRKNALKFIVHIVGDLHQPLHTVREDVGGNFFFVKYDNSTDGKKISCYNPDNNKDYLTSQEKLHRIWDSCILSQPLKTMSVTKYARKLNDEMSSQNKTEYRQGSHTAWLLEAHRTAINNAYDEIPKAAKIGGNSYSTIPADYFEDNQTIVERQLQRAGIRLAKILNEIFDS